MEDHDARVVFDEVQRVPEIFRYIKLIVDEKRETYGRFVVTGSAQFAFMRQVSESLAGRIGLLTLLPLQYSELPGRSRESSIFRGSYPELVRRSYKGAADWYSSYLDTYLTRDVRDLHEVGDMRDFRRCLQLLAARVAQVLNMSELARDVGVSVPTIKKWISVLEASYIVFLLPPYYRNLGKRIIKSPKIYFHDTGLVSSLTGVVTKELFERGPLTGAIFENYVVAEVLKQEAHKRSGAELYYCRESNGREIDLVVDRKTTREHIEIKTSATYRPEMGSFLHDVRGEADRSIVVYRGKNLAAGGGVRAMNYREYLME
jgi:predicted AAA+ superfamily ATPase